MSPLDRLLERYEEQQSHYRTLLGMAAAAKSGGTLTQVGLDALAQARLELDALARGIADEMLMERRGCRARG